MARRLVKRDDHVDATRQRSQGCVTTSLWSEDELFSRFARKADSELPGVEALALDDIPSVSSAGTRACSGASTTVRWASARTSRRSGAAAASRWTSLCRGRGLRTARAVARRAFLTSSPSVRTGSAVSSRSTPPAAQASVTTSCSPTPDSVTCTIFAPESRVVACGTSPVSSLPWRCGRRVPGRSRRPSHRAASEADHGQGSVLATTRRSLSPSSRRLWGRKH